MGGRAEFDVQDVQQGQQTQSRHEQERIAQGWEDEPGVAEEGDNDCFSGGLGR